MEESDGRKLPSPSHNCSVALMTHCQYVQRERLDVFLDRADTRVCCICVACPQFFVS